MTIASDDAVLRVGKAEVRNRCKAKTAWTPHRGEMAAAISRRRLGAQL
jgi:hypothetical protein